MTQQGKETRNGKRFVAISNDFKVYRMVVERIGKERDGGIDGNHKENTDDTVTRLARANVGATKPRLTVSVPRASNSVLHASRSGTKT